MGIPYEHGDKTGLDLRDLEEVELNNLTVNSLNISGTLGVGESQDVGTTGSLLTINGSGAVEWEEKYYTQAELTAEFSVPSGNAHHAINLWTSDTVSSISAGNDIGTTDWTCPVDGIYRLSGYLSFVNYTTKLKNIELLIKNAGDTITYISSAKKFTSYAQKISLNFNKIIRLAESDTIRFLVKAVTDDGTDTAVRTDEWSVYTIERIKKEPLLILNPIFEGPGGNLFEGPGGTGIIGIGGGNP
jgi:hypothetical protein